MSVEALGTGGLWRFFDSLANFPNVWVGIIVGITIMLVSHGISLSAFWCPPNVCRSSSSFTDLVAMKIPILPRSHTMLLLLLRGSPRGRRKLSYLSRVAESNISCCALFMGRPCSPRRFTSGLRQRCWLRIYPPW